MPAYNAARTLKMTYADLPHDVAEFLMTDRSCTAQEAVDIGLINRAVPAAELARLDEMLDFCDRNAPGGRHHRVEVPGGLPVDEVAGGVAFPGLDECHIRPNRGLEDIGLAVEEPRLPALGEPRADARARVEPRDARPARAQAKEVKKSYFDKALEKGKPSVTKDIEDSYHELEAELRTARGKQMKNEKPIYMG